MPDTGGLNWGEVGEAAAVALMAAGAAFAGARRVWKKGLGELLREPIRREVGAAVRSTVRDMRRDVTDNVAKQLREALHEELSPMRDELDELTDRVARTEGAVEVLSQAQRTKDTPQ